MSAEILRQAAELMRKRAESATPTRYGFSSTWTTPTTMLTKITANGGDVIAEHRSDGSSLMDLNHLSYWHPAVALAVADWLDLMVDLLVGQLLYDHSAEVERALAVARAYLSGQS